MKRLMMVALLAGCTPAPDTPQAACEAEANRDPVVHELMVKSAGSEEFNQSHLEEMKQARRRATLRCLAGRGLIRPGGVEPPLPVR